ncbi:unnamed protein product [Adineta steineri]|uniref:Methyltransferase domain-containing protein n=1 Tax=Adineta steineri TaxID=433720 RepID=A0A814XY09_9BILA|nr:unnamed protein product [Adineta steineri]
MAVVADISHDAKEIYDSIAEQYVEVKKAPHRTAVEQYTLFDVMLLKNEPELGKGARILDMACGDGHCTRKLRELFPEASYICGLDISSSMIDIAKQCESQLQQNIDYINVDGKDLPISEPLYDIVTAAYYLNYAQTRDELCVMIKANKINELERKGFISDLINSKRLHIVDLMDGNNYFPVLKIQDSQISLNNTTQVHVFLVFNDSQSFC